MDLKRFIFNCLPYKVAIDRINRNRTFEKDFLAYYSAGKRREFDKDLRFKCIVSVCGYGYSGSGAIVDLLREYSCCKVLGGVDKEGSVTNKKENVGEIDILRLAGGLLELEKYIQCNNPFQNDAAINRLIRLFDNSPIIKCSNKNQELACTFLASMLELVLPNLSRSCYNLHLKDTINENSSIYYLKNLDVNDYYSLCRGFICSLLNDFYESDKHVLVADQLFADLENKTMRNLRYLPNLKTITVYRDPRDVFEYATNNKIQWIPYYSVDVFIKWLEIQYRSLKENPMVLNLRFEDLVNDYSQSILKVEEFLGINAEHHKNLKENFNPNRSRQNIGIWKNSCIDALSFQKIESNFPNLCYYG